MSTIDPSQLSAADMSNPALTAQDLADITAARPDLRPYVATHPSLYPALGQWLSDQGVVPAQPPTAEQPVSDQAEAVDEAVAEQGAAVNEPVQQEQAGPATDATPALGENPTTDAPAVSDEELERTITEGAREKSAAELAVDGQTPAAQPQYGQAPQGQPQYGQAPQGQPQYGQAPQGQPQYGQAPQGRPQYGQAPQGQPGQSAGQQLGAAAQQFGAAANTAFNQFQNAVVSETGKVSGRSVRATYALIGVAAASLLVFISMLLPYVEISFFVTESTSLLGGGGWFPVTFLLLLLANVGVGVAYWLTNQKWAFISVGAGSLALGIMSLIETFYILANDNDLIDFSIGFYLFPLFSIALGAAGVILLLELKEGKVAPLNTAPAMLNQFGQPGQYGQQQGFQAGQSAFGQQRPQQPQYGQQAQQPQFGQQAQQGQQPQYGQQAQQGQQPQYGQQAQYGQQGQQNQQGNQPFNPFGPQA